MAARWGVLALFALGGACSGTSSPRTETDYARVERILAKVGAVDEPLVIDGAAWSTIGAGSGPVIMANADVGATPGAGLAASLMYSEVFGVEDAGPTPDEESASTECAMGNGGPLPASLTPGASPPPAQRELAAIQYLACAKQGVDKPCEVILRREDGLRNAHHRAGVIRYDWAWLLGVGKEIGVTEGSDQMGMVLFGFLAHEYGHYLDYRYGFALSRGLARVFTPAPDLTVGNRRELWADYVAGCVLAQVTSAADEMTRQDLELAVKAISRTAVGDHPVGTVRAQAIDYGWQRCHGSASVTPGVFFPGGRP